MLQPTRPPTHHLCYRASQELATEIMPETERDGLNDFMRMVRLLFHYEYLESRDRMKRSFDLVTAAQDDNASLIKVTEEQLSPSQFHDLSVDFVGDFCSLMAVANFSLLTQKEWELAKAEHFMFTLPCEIAWNKFDKNLIGAFLRQNPALSQGLTQFADSALLFKRGNGVAKAKGMFISEKIEMLMEMCIVEPALRLVGKPKVVFAAPDGEGKNVGGSAAGGAGAGANSAHATQAQRAGGAKAGGRPDTTVVERRTLRRLLPTPLSVLNNLFSTMELQEPTFKEVVLIYRMARPTLDHKAGPGGAGPLILKSFHDIPMADLEMIFPEVNITVKFKDMLVNVSLSVVAIGTFLWTLMRGIQWSTEIITLISMLGGKVAQSVTALLAAQSRYAGMMAKALQAKSANSQVGMLMHLMESMEDQECKEMILSYCVLSGNGNSMTLREIDTVCESLLYTRFGLMVDFDVEGAMVKLLREGLVEQRAGVLYSATPLRKALQRLDTKWDNLFNYRDDGGAAARDEAAMQTEAARIVRYQTVEATLKQQLAKTDAERAKVVGRLKEQQEEISHRIKILEAAMTSYKWRTG